MEGILEDFLPVEDLMQNIIKVIGVGGGGCNAVSRMYDEGIQGVSFAVLNTDSASLSHSPVPIKLQLGSGLGAGAKPEIGRAEAESSIDSIERLFDDQTKMVFVTATMGGGTGTGAAPVVARVAKERGLLTIGVVTIPFHFEHRRKIVKALKGVDELRKNVDAMLIVNNERLCDVYSDTTMSLKDALAEADNVLKNAVKGISELITISSEGNINLDFRDVETTMRNGGGAIMAIGRANGEQRVERAILDALDSPLIHGNEINRAKRILFNIYASDQVPIRVLEMQEISEFFDQLDPDIDVIWGTSTDNSLGEDAKVIILAADMGDELSATQMEEEYEDDHYERLIARLYQPLAKFSTETDSASAHGETEPTFTVEPAPEPEPAVPEAIGEGGDGSTRMQSLEASSAVQSLEASPTMQSLEASPTMQSLEASPTKQSSEASPTKQSSEASPTKQASSQPTTTLGRWKNWLNKKIGEMISEED